MWLEQTKIKRDCSRPCIKRRRLQSVVLLLSVVVVALEVAHVNKVHVEI